MIAIADERRLEAYFQQDNHIWLTIGGSNWAIRRIKYPTIYVWRGYEPNLEFAEIDMTFFNYDLYCEMAADYIRRGIW